MKRITDELAGALALYLQEQGYWIETELGEVRSDGFHTITMVGKGWRYVTIICKAPNIHVSTISHFGDQSGVGAMVIDSSNPNSFDELTEHIGKPGTRAQYNDLYNFIMLKQAASREQRLKGRKW